MRLVVERDRDLYRLWMEDDGVRRPLLGQGERPSWAGGWAGVDGLGGYRLEEAMLALRAFGLSMTMARRVLTEMNNSRWIQPTLRSSCHHTPNP